MTTTMAVDGRAAPARAGRTDAAGAGAWMEVAGAGILRYGLVGILLYYGAFKFHPVEAEAIRPLVVESPFMGWMYGVLSVQAVSTVIGVTEIVVAALLLARPWSPRAGAAGGIGAAAIFLATLSFLATTPGIWESVPGWPLPLPAGGGGFVLKDLFLLGAAIGIAGESLRAASLRRRPS